MKTALPHFNTMGGKKEWFFHVLKCGKAFMSHLTLHFYCPNDGGNYNVHSLPELNIFIDGENFKYTIKFLEIFNELYWTQQILPESLKNIEQEANKSTVNYRQQKI